MVFFFSGAALYPVGLIRKEFKNYGDAVIKEALAIFLKSSKIHAETCTKS